jgi:penicillin amidase
MNAYLAMVRANPALLPGEYGQLPTPIVSGDDLPDWTRLDTFALARLQQYQLSSTLDEETNYGRFAQTYALSPLADPGKLNAWLRAAEPVHSYTLNPTAARLRHNRAKTELAHVAPRARQGLAAFAPVLEALHLRSERLQAALGALGLGLGSNNWVVDAAHSTSGAAMVANDPHLPLAYPPLFYLSAMTASDDSGLELAGGTFPGIPGALVGRGKHVGWGVTIVGYDVTDLYLERLTVDAQGAPAVMFKGAAVKLLVVPHSIQVRGGAAVPFTVLVVPHHGPIVQADRAAGTAVSVRWTGHEATNDLHAILGLNVATGVGKPGDDPVTSTTAFAALTAFATGAQNFVLADDQGNIGYDPHALVPKRPWAGSMPAGTPLLPWLPLPGDGSAEWGTGDPADDCAGGAPKPACWVSEAALPSGVNPPFGYFVTANSDPIGDTADNDPIINPRSAEPSYLSFDWDDPTGLRAKRITDLLQAALMAKGQVSLEDMMAIQSDHQLSLAKQVLPSLEAVPPQGQSPTWAAALAMLQQWSSDGFDCPTGLSGSAPDGAPTGDPVALRSANACLLFHSFFRTLLTNVFADDLSVAGVSRNGGAEIRALLYMLAPGTPAADKTFCHDVDGTGTVTAPLTCSQQLVRALTSAWASLTGAYGAPANWLWGRVHTLTTTSLAAPLVGPPFQAGPFARPGGAETVDVGSPALTSTDPHSFAYTQGANVRHISVMGAAPVIKMQLPGPQRDGPWGVVAPGPNDLLSSYVVNRYFDFALGQQLEAGSGVVSTQRFTAP